ncbi:hypothetical protein KJ841_00780 [Patescibacteria group bacterium]|nr:hypothetical protein [Patescibacteria group bacterium]
MKGISLLITLVFLSSLGVGPIGILSGSYGVKVLAQDTEFTLPKAGITPESPFYFLDRFVEFLQEFFTFSPEGKAHLQITFAAERIAEIKVVLEVKGVEAPGLDVAQSRLQAHLAKAATIVANQKAKGEDVTSLTQELDDEFEGPKSALAQIFKEQKRALEAQEKKLKAQLRAAHRAGDTALEEQIAGELGQVKGQLELLELREEDLEEKLEAEEEQIEEEMEAQHKAKEAITEAEEELAELQEEAVEEEVEIPAEALAKFNSLLSQAKSALVAENYEEAKRLAEQAEDALENVEETIEELEEAKEKEEEEKEKLEEQRKEEEEKLKEAEEETEEKVKEEEEQEQERQE